MMAPIPGNNREEPEKDTGEDKTISSLDTPQFTIQAGSSDSGGEHSDDEDDTAYAGYQPLPQEPGGETNDTAVQDVDEEQATASGSNSEAVLDRLIMRSLNNQDFAEASAPSSLEEASAPEIPVEIAERKELWSSTKPPVENIKIDSEKADKIREAMVGFKLPTTHVPEWAKVIPEEQWKTKLIDRLGKSSTSTKEAKMSPKQNQNKDDCGTSQQTEGDDSKT